MPWRDLVGRAAMSETNGLYRNDCRWWAEIEVLAVTGVTTANVEAKNTAINHVERTALGYRNPDRYKWAYSLERYYGWQHEQSFQQAFASRGAPAAFRFGRGPG